MPIRRPPISALYAHNARKHDDNLRVAIILDALGYYSNTPATQLPPIPLSLLCPSRGDFVAMVSNMGSMGVTRRFTRAFRRHSSFPSLRISAPQIFPGIAASDQNPFWLHGYKAFVITDTGRYRYPFFHSAKDTLDKIDCNSVAQVTKGIFEAVLALDRS